MKKYEETLYKILKKSEFLSSQDLEEAYNSAKDLNRSFADTLVFRGLLSEEVLSRLVAESLNLPYVPLKNYLIPDEILNLIPENLARRYRMIPFEKTDKGLSLAMEDPQNFEALETAKRQVELPVSVFFTSPADLARALNQYKRDIKKKFKDIVTQNIKKAGSVSEKDTVEVSAVKLVDLKIENKLNFPVSLKKIKPKEIEAIDDFLEEGNLVIFDIEDWEKILKKLSIQSEKVL
ncbi:hypothetical protein KKE45_01420, partial [Patescibacteria group bacterium]|nr:hypothetical protein [Patescibacteria group bacterium]